MLKKIRFQNISQIHIIIASLTSKLYFCDFFLAKSIFPNITSGKNQRKNHILLEDKCILLSKVYLKKKPKKHQSNVSIIVFLWVINPLWVFLNA